MKLAIGWPEQDQYLGIAQFYKIVIHAIVFLGWNGGADARAVIFQGLQQERSQETTMKNTLAALFATLALGCLGTPAVLAQSSAHMMATPDDLK
ncbi:MAG: hypothetical protein ACREX0_15080, partial [Noviherbaspirillum sp.]